MGEKIILTIHSIIHVNWAILEVHANIKLIGETVVLYLVGMVKAPNVLNLVVRDWISDTNAIVVNPLKDCGALFSRAGFC